MTIHPTFRAALSLPLLTVSLMACAPADSGNTNTSAAQTTAAASYQTVSVQALYDRLGEEIHVIDVRTPEEFAGGHIQGAQLLPLGELEGRMAEVPESGEIYVICRSGNRSAQASDLLTQAGHRVINVDGGMGDWEAAGYPVAK